MTSYQDELPGTVKLLAKFKQKRKAIRDKNCKLPYLSIDNARVIYTKKV